MSYGIEYVFMGIDISLFSGTDYTNISGGEKNILGSP